jgi:hypothetical protein
MHVEQLGASARSQLSPNLASLSKRAPCPSEFSEKEPTDTNEAGAVPHSSAARAALTVQNMGQPVRDVSVHLILFALVEDFVASAGVEPVPKLELTLR